MMRVAVVLGTRPEIIMFPIIRELQRRRPAERTSTSYNTSLSTTPTTWTAFSQSG
jgi:UDP-N-acetylglucosamine 2-epimerase